ncbi:MAG TPA: proteasome subunit alpha [Actinomycetes bacterium]|jgi:proteasome alpha subunit|nr:proteasome subunit alpha [Actinomycetes bacterium]
MSMGFYVSPEQQMKDKADFARKGISRGRPLVVLEYAGGIVFVAENPSSHLHKIAEIYDRIAFAAVGKFSELENLRVAGVRLADIRGYAYGREDVTSRAIANFYSQNLGQIFIQEPKPYEIELCVAEVGTEGAANALYHVLYDGTVVDRKGFLAMGGQSDELNAELQRSYSEGLDLGGATDLAVRTLRAATPSGDSTARLEVAVLERGRPRRSFRRLSQEEVTARTGTGARAGAANGAGPETGAGAAKGST